MIGMKFKEYSLTYKVLLEPPTLWFEGHRFEISINSNNFPKLPMDCHELNFSKRNLYLFKSFKDLSISPTSL